MRNEYLLSIWGHCHLFLQLSSDNCDDIIVGIVCALIVVDVVEIIVALLFFVCFATVASSRSPYLSVSVKVSRRIGGRKKSHAFRIQINAWEMPGFLLNDFVTCELVTDWLLNVWLVSWSWPTHIDWHRKVKTKKWSLRLVCRTLKASSSHSSKVSSFGESAFWTVSFHFSEKTP